MQVLNNEIFLTQGEQITLDFLLQNKDGSPYIISNKLKNPYFLVTVASSQYEQSDRYVLNKWCDIKGYFRFYTTQPIAISSTDGFPVNLPDSVKQDVISNNNGDYSTYAVWYTVDNNDNKTYYRWAGTTFIKYECRFIVTFKPEVTEQWTGRNFIYEIKLIDGEVNKDYTVSNGKRPIINYNFVQTILDSTKLSVTPNINNGGINL